MGERQGTGLWHQHTTGCAMQSSVVCLALGLAIFAIGAESEGSMVEGSMVEGGAAASFTSIKRSTPCPPKGPAAGPAVVGKLRAESDMTLKKIASMEALLRKKEKDGPAKKKMKKIQAKVKAAGNATTIMKEIMTVQTSSKKKLSLLRKKLKQATDGKAAGKVAKLGEKEAKSQKKAAKKVKNDAKKLKKAVKAGKKANCKGKIACAKIAAKIKREQSKLSSAKRNLSRQGMNAKHAEVTTKKMVTVRAAAKAKKLQKTEKKEEKKVAKDVKKEKKKEAVKASAATGKPPCTKSKSGIVAKTIAKAKVKAALKKEKKAVKKEHKKASKLRKKEMKVQKHLAHKTDQKAGIKAKGKAEKKVLKEKAKLHTAKIKAAAEKKREAIEIAKLKGAALAAAASGSNSKLGVIHKEAAQVIAKMQAEKKVVAKDKKKVKK